MVCLCRVANEHVSCHLLGSCGENRILCIDAHTYPQESNIVQHRVCGENGILHMETGIKKQPESKTKRADQADMWQD
jgi:hypothetical protein